MPIRSKVTLSALLQLAFLALFIVLGWEPADRQTWLMENTLVAVGAVAAWYARRWFYWSTRSWALVVLFLGLHEIGTHFTYPGVPYDQAIASLTGIELNQLFGWQRNQYDRFVHLAYGVLLALPIREIIIEKCQVKGAWASLIAWSFVLSTSMLYELMEWIGGQYLGGGDSSFVGAQGDFWDAQKDMAVAAGGALVVLIGRGHALRNRLMGIRLHVQQPLRTESTDQHHLHNGRQQSTMLTSQEEIEHELRADHIIGSRSLAGEQHPDGHTRSRRRS